VPSYFKRSLLPSHHLINVLSPIPPSHPPKGLPNHVVTSHQLIGFPSPTRTTLTPGGLTFPFHTTLLLADRAQYPISHSDHESRSPHLASRTTSATLLPSNPLSPSFYRLIHLSWCTTPFTLPSNPSISPPSSNLPLVIPCPALVLQLTVKK
jgi:hypothetical protein